MITRSKNIQLFEWLELYVNIKFKVIFFVCVDYQSHMAVNERSLFKSVA